jgi:hypothetical protein
MTRKYEKNIEMLVASYASVGRRHRRQRFYAVIAAAVALPLLAFIGYQTWNYSGNRITVDQNGWIDKQAQEIQEIQESLENEIQAINVQRLDFERSRSLLTEQSELLKREITEASEQRRVLEAKNDEFAGQQDRISDEIAAIEDRRRAIQQQKAEIEREDPLLERERLAMKEERRKLEQQRKRFALEGSLLEKEIQAINEQRTELAVQRMAVEERRKELQSLLEKTKGIGNKTNDTGTTTTKVRPDNDLKEQDVSHSDKSGKGAESVQGEANPEIIAHAEPSRNASVLGLPYVEEYRLEQMRGGFSIGDHVEITIGLTRSASINGVEQFSSTISIANALEGISPAEMENVNATLIQNGPGNYVSPDVLEAMSGNFSTLVQNSLDDQEISTQNVYDVSIDNISDVIGDIAASRAIDDTIALIQ